MSFGDQGRFFSFLGEVVGVALFVEVSLSGLLHFEEELLGVGPDL